MAKKVSLKVAGKKAVVRCSSLPLLFSCPNAILNPERLTPVRVENGFEELGRLIHAAIQKAVETGEIDLRQIEARYSEAELERAKLLFNNGMRVVSEGMRNMKNPQFEVEVAFETDRFAATGHVDILDVSPNVAYVVDFKTGRTRDDHYHQMVGYGVGAWTKVGRPEKFVVHIAYVYLEDNEVTSFTLTADDLKDWIKQLDALPSIYTVNRRCVFCSLNNTCHTFRDYLKGGMGFLLDTQKAPDRITRMSDGDKSKLALALKMASESVERIRSHIKDEALKSGKDMDLKNGDKFAIVSQRRRMLLTQKALPVLAKYVTARDIAGATTLGLSALLTAATARVKGPMRAVIRQEVEKKLEEAGAIITHETTQLRTVFAGDKRWPKKKASKK